MYHCGEAVNTTVIGTQLYFTSVRQFYKMAIMLSERENVFSTFPSSGEVSNDETKIQSRPLTGNHSKLKNNSLN